MKQKKKQVVTIAYKEIANTTKERLYRTYQTTAAGLKTAQVATARDNYGTNQLPTSEKNTFFLEIIKAFITPFTLVLLGLGAMSFVTDVILPAPQNRDYFGSSIIFTMVILSGVMTVIQSVRSNRAAAELKALVKMTTTVKRDGIFQAIPTAELVCGDLVKLAAGDQIPADIRLIQAKDLFVAQSALTGESYPVEKAAEMKAAAEKEVTSLETLVFMGSTVVSGSAEGIVIATGTNSLFGDVVKALREKTNPTNFETGIRKTSYLFIRFMAVMAPVVIVLNGLTKGDWTEAFFFGLSVAVGLTPEMLPMIVTTNLVKGATRMAQRGTIVKNLNAIQNFGAMDILCTDKTGTLTEDRIILDHYRNLEGQEDERILQLAYFNSFYQSGLNNLLDEAVIEAAEKKLGEEVAGFHKVDELPFDFERRRMSVLVRSDKGETELITKGALEEIVSISPWMEVNGTVTAFTEAAKTKVLREVEHLNGQGLRVIGLSRKAWHGEGAAVSVSDEGEMILVGYLAFLDPPKRTAKQAIATLESQGVTVKVLTGDNQRVTQAVCRQVGLDEEVVVSGGMFAQASEAEKRELVEGHRLFVKLTPQQKQEIVEMLQQNGHTVGFLGDGINDAPAMKSADIGISVDTAVDIAKEAADVLLLEKDLTILDRGILSGRETFGNIMKYVKVTASSNFGNMFSVLVASTFLPFLPMLPLQILCLNLLYDTSCLTIPWDRMDAEYLRKPKRWAPESISKFMIWFGPTSSIFDVTTFFLLYQFICPAVVGGPFDSLNAAQKVTFIAVFHAGWFIESLWTQSLVLHALRTPKLPFFQSRSSFVLFMGTLLSVCIGSLIPATSFGRHIGLVPLPAVFWVILVGTLGAYLLLVSWLKPFFVKHYSELI